MIPWPHIFWLGDERHEGSTEMIVKRVLTLSCCPDPGKGAEVKMLLGVEG